MVNRVKDEDAESREISAKLRDDIVEKAERIPPSDDEWVAAALTFGISLILENVLEKLFGESNSRKKDLQDANKKLRELWESVRQAENKLLKCDKDLTYQVLKNAKSRLDDAWDAWKKVQEEQSNKLRDEIISMAVKAVPDDSKDWITVVLPAAVTDGFSLIMEAFRDTASELQARREELQKVWDYFNSEKNKLLRPDKDAAYAALKEAESRLNGAWREINGAKKEAMDAHYEAKRKKHEEWRNRVKANLEKNQQQVSKLENALERKHQNLEKNQQQVSKLENALERKHQNLEKNQQQVSRLENALERKHRHLDELNEKLNDATNDSYRERVDGWIQEEIRAIEDIEETLNEVAGWIEEDSNAIQSIQEHQKRVDGWIQEEVRAIEDIETQLKRVEGWIKEESDKLNN